MKKIISLFQRNYDTDHFVRDEIVIGAEWVVNGEGIATRKYDGTCCMVSEGKLYKRYDAKKGRTPPPNFEPAQDPDPVTGHWPGWLPVGENDKYHLEAWGDLSCMDFFGPPKDGTYELCGPKVNGNPEGFSTHILIPHWMEEHPDAPRDFQGLKKYLKCLGIEGLVWHHPDGRMVKIKRKDFNYGAG